MNTFIRDKNFEQSVKDVFESWSGYEDIRDLMLEFPNVDIYLAGGLLRDIILQNKKITKDVDLFIKGDGDEMFVEALLNKGSLSHGPFGSPRWIPANSKEFYADVIYIKNFRNGLWECEDIIDVLNQFDFTGNAVAIDLRRGQFFNPQNGVRDLDRRTMRAVRFDYPEQTFIAGYHITRPAVVWFRILHYASVLNLTIEFTTLAWLREHQGYVKYVDEFEQLFFTIQKNALHILG